MLKSCLLFSLTPNSSWVLFDFIKPVILSWLLLYWSRIRTRNCVTFSSLSNLVHLPQLILLIGAFFPHVIITSSLPRTTFSLRCPQTRISTPLYFFSSHSFLCVLLFHQTFMKCLIWLNSSSVYGVPALLFQALWRIIGEWHSLSFHKLWAQLFSVLPNVYKLQKSKLSNFREK